MWLILGVLLLITGSFTFGLLIGQGHGPAMLQKVEASIEVTKRGSRKAWQFARNRWRKEEVSVAPNSPDGANPLS